MNPFDRMIDLFSAGERRERVWAVVAIGTVACIAAAVGGTIFFRSIHARGIEGTGRWLAPTPGVVEVSLSARDAGLLPPSARIDAEYTTPGGAVFAAPARIAAIDADAGGVRIESPDLPATFRTTKPFAVRLILYDKPLWKFLVGDETRDPARR